MKAKKENITHDGDLYVKGDVEKIGQINDTPEELADLLNEYFNSKEK